MSAIIRTAIAFSIANYAFTFFVFGLLSALVAVARARQPDRSLVVEKLLAWHTSSGVSAPATS